MASDIPKKTEEERKADDARRQELERLEINAAYDNSGYTQDSPNDSSATLGVKSSSANNKNVNNNGTVRSLSDDFLDRTDRYGFIHDEKLPAITEAEIKRNNIEKMREKKWIIMLKEWPSYNGRNIDKLIGRVFKGIPNSMRNPGWTKFLDIDTQIKAQSGVYEKMRNLARLYSLDLRQIDLDINRTFRNNTAYKKRYNQRQVQLYNILAAYSIYNTEIGYCQGMATVTALLLMYLSDEEKTFWALSQLMSNSKYSLHGFFKQDFPKLIRYADKHDMIIKTFLPKIHKKFIKFNITSLLYTTKWFLQCYLDALPFSLVLRVWDVYLLKGDIVMLAMSYCILRLHKRRLLQKDFDMDKINEFLNHKLPDDFLYSDDETMIKLEECIEKLQKYRFTTGPLLEAIPHNELPKIPFGDFKKIDKNEIISNITQKSAVQTKNSLDRNAAVELMAKERLEVEKKKQVEERRLRKQASRDVAYLENGEDPTNPTLDTILNKSGEPILNISDDDEDYEVSDSDDDLNPSKISEYDDDRADKESMISNMTRHSHNPTMTRFKNMSSLSSSQVSIDANKEVNGSVQNVNGNINNSSPITVRSTVSSKPPHQGSSKPYNRQVSEYENKPSNSSSDYENLSNKPSPIRQPSQSVTSITQKPFKQSPQKSHQFSNILPLKDEAKKSPIAAENTASFTPSRTIPTSQSYIISPNYQTASIISSPPPLSPTTFMSSSRAPTGASQSSAHIASIITNPSYYNTTNNSLNNVNYEYVRSPHGIYTRVNSSILPPQYDVKSSVKKSPSFRILPKGSGLNGHSSAQNIPQSTSSFIISSSALNKTNSNSKLLVSSTKSPSSSVIVHPDLLAQHPPSTSNTPDASTKQPSTSKRTSSLRSIQNKFQSHFMNTSTSTSKINGHSSTQSKSNTLTRATTPTKLNLQNHSIRIANLQKKQAHQNMYGTISAPKSSSKIVSNTNYPTISIISQGPRPPLSNGNYQSYHRQTNLNSKSMVNSNSHILKTKNSEDLIEQYDYI